MPKIYTRISEDSEENLEKRARKKGFVKPSGDVNKSAYLRNLIKKDINQSKASN